MIYVYVYNPMYVYMYLHIDICSYAQKDRHTHTHTPHSSAACHWISGPLVQIPSDAREVFGLRQRWFGTSPSSPRHAQGQQEIALIPLLPNWGSDRFRALFGLPSQFHGSGLKHGVPRNIQEDLKTLFTKPIKQVL